MNEVTVNYMRGGTAIGSGGTINSVGMDWKPYEAGALAVVNVGATPSGTLIYRLCGGTATGDVATVFAAGTVLPGAGGTLVGSLVADVTTEYANVQLISTGGTVLASAELIGKKRTLTT
jgi:hypothetical protein